MEWINKKNRMPDDPEYDGRSIDVMVTDGKSWGHGAYYKDTDYWAYILVGNYESTDNNITHWAYPPVLPL